MDLSNILSVGFSALVLIVVIHISVFYVVRTMYPPVRKVTFVEPPPAVSIPEPPPVFTQAPNTDKQDVVLPTYETNVQTDPPRQEGEALGSIGSIGSNDTVGTLHTTTG